MPGFLELELTDEYEVSQEHGCWEPNFSPLQEQHMLLAPEPSLPRSLEFSYVTLPPQSVLVSMILISYT